MWRAMLQCNTILLCEQLTLDGNVTRDSEMYINEDVFFFEFSPGERVDPPPEFSHSKTAQSQSYI
jgi:hypothetical protein